MIPEHIKKLRKNPQNYLWKGSIYYCKEDPYVILPKRCAWMGWTFNFAHPKVWPMLFYVSFAVTVPFLFVICLVHQNNWPVYVTWIFLLINIALLCLWAHKESTKSP